MRIRFVGSFHAKVSVTGQILSFLPSNCVAWSVSQVKCMAAKAYTLQYVGRREVTFCFLVSRKTAEMGFPFGVKYIQKVWLYAILGTQSFLAWQSRMNFVEE